ncbi:DUF6808 domain-containing protein [uncultured Alistipes sp.]|uniref:DUF6808 domain-containing protein n=1 Tax=uncultured Alistipes sp. TaxID=538949 RepID=UPI0026328872|nr:hypothetical protein [uncultured Alistipes sp.]
MKRFEWMAIAVAALVCGFLLGRRTAAPVVEVAERIRVDTVYYDRPAAVRIDRRPATVSVPRLLFAGQLRTAEVAAEATAGTMPAGVTTDSAAVTAPDSVSVQVRIETRIYEDSLYRAQVSGPVVGPLAPSLDWISVRDRTRTVTETVVRRHRFAVTAGVGAAWTPRGIQPTVGVQVGVVLWRF